MTARHSFKKHILFLSVALAVASAPLMMTDNFTKFFIDEAVAASEGGGHRGVGQKSGAGKGAMLQGQGKASADKRQGKTTISDLLKADDGDDDSDRPDWAGVPGKDGKPGGGSSGSDTKKGTDYGDIVVMLRNDDGTLVEEKEGDNLITYAVAPDGTLIKVVDGEIPEGSEVQPVEFGRLNLARAPSSVLEHSLTEALSKLDGGVLGDDVTLDPSGRLVIDGLTIDSPLENLALYEALLTTEAVKKVITLSATSSHDGADVTYTFSVPEDMRLDLAAAAIAAASDKTGTLTIDEISVISDFLGVSDELASYVTDYKYNREDTYSGVMVDVLVLQPDGSYEVEAQDLFTTINWNTVEINSIKDNETKTGIDIFTQAADDSVQSIEFIHDNAVE